MHTDLLNPCQAGSLRGLERTRYFPRQLVGPDDLTQDQEYFREKLRRHNRLLHGWGVVCGACVRRGRGACEAIVDPGYIIGPYGDEIVIDQPVTVDLCRMGATERMGCCGEGLNPWCGETRADCTAGVRHLAIRYSECRSTPIRSASGACGCGCDETQCEYSRIRDSFALRVLTDLPGTYSTPMPRPGGAVLVPCLTDRTGRSCPACPAEPWVILADISVTADCTIRAIDCFAHRRFVVSFANYYLLCTRLPGQTVSFPGADFSSGVANARAFAAFSGGADLVDIRSVGSSASPRAAVTLRRPDGSPVTLPAYFTVQGDETLAQLLDREGERYYYDPVTDGTYTLRELFTMAGADPETRLTGTAAALVPLENSVLNVEGLRAAGNALPELLDSDGLDRLRTRFLGAPGRAVELPATALSSVGRRSFVGQQVEEMTIGAIAALGRDEFVGRVEEAASARQRRSAGEQAGQVWEQARRVASLAAEGLHPAG